MKRDLESTKAALAGAPRARWKGILTRRVEFAALTAYNPPKWLHTSGRPNRFNPRGIDCVYFAGDPEVARIEYKDAWQDDEGGGQPVTEFHAEVNLLRVLDLTFAATRAFLNLENAEIFANWRLAKRPTATQLLGQAVSETKLFSAIRYHSHAAARANRPGVNVVIFRNCLRAPEHVRIVGPGRKPLEQWP